MAVSLTHAFTSGKAASADSTLVDGPKWDAEHTLTLATDKLLGRISAGGGAAEEVTCTDFAQSLLDDTDAATARTTLGVGTGDTPTFAGIIAPSLTGSTASGGDLALSSTSDATKGTISLGDATTGLFYDETTGRLASGENEDTIVVAGSTFGLRAVMHTDSDTEATYAAHVHTTTAAWGPIFYGARTRGTGAAETAVAADDLLLMIAALGHDGTDYALGSQILFEVDGTPGANDMPTRIRVLVSPDGSGTPAEAMRINSAGDVSIGIAASASGQLHVDQASTTGAQPVLYLDQADVDQPFATFVTTIGVGNAIEAVGAKSLTTTHFVLVNIDGVGNRYFPVGTIA